MTVLLLVLSSGETVPLAPNDLIVLCTGPHLDSAAQQRADAMHARMAPPESASTGGDELDAVTLTPLQIHFHGSISNHLLAGAYFAEPDPRVALRRLRSTLKFFRTPPFDHFFESLRCWVQNQPAFAAEFGAPDGGAFIDPCGFPPMGGM